MIFLSAVLVLTGCAVTDLDRTVHFTAYRTFDWGEADIVVKNPVYESSLINKNIRHTVEEEFAKPGLVQDRDSPDFIVSYHSYTEEKQRYSRAPYYPYAYYPFRFYPFFMVGGGLMAMVQPMLSSTRKVHSS